MPFFAQITTVIATSRSDEAIYHERFPRSPRRPRNDRGKMKTHFTFENLYRAYIDCRKRKAKSFYHLKFAENLEENLLDLEKQLQNRTYKPERSIAFIVQKPKIREIFAADFRDRVVHHLLFNYLSPIFEKIFIHDSWACRKGKGTHQAMIRLQQFAREIQRERERRLRRALLSQNGYQELLYQY